MHNARAALNNVDMVRLINENCIAVALTDPRLDLRNAAFLGEARGSGNALMLLTPSGKPLAGNYQIEAGLKNWRSLSEAERKQESAQVAQAAAPKYPRPPVTPPPRGLILKFYERYLDRAPGGALGKAADKSPWKAHAEPQHDHMWLTEAEWQSLLPANPGKGQQSSVPEAITKRIFCGYLVAMASGTGPSWGWESMQPRELTITVEEATPALVRLRLDGSMKAAETIDVHVGHKDGQRVFEKHTFAIDARLLGYVHYDVAAKVITRFDVVALGDVRGKEGISHPDFRPGPHGWSFELVSGESWLDRIPPSTPHRCRLHGLKAD